MNLVKFLEEDISQQNNLAESNPEKLQELIKTFESLRGKNYKKVQKIELK